MTEILKVENLKKYFNNKSGILHAVDDVNFTIYEGNTLGVVGESGCGKSTLGRVVLKLIEPTDGKIFFEGRDITEASARETKQLRREMQIIFQDPFSSLNPRRSVTEIIAEPLKVYKIHKSSYDRNKRVYELMDLVGLAKRFANSYPHELDGGRRQRIGVARALSLNPKLIVCDEPVSALDVSIQAQILNLLQDLQEQHGLTYIFVTHDMSVVKHISTDILVMYIGVLVEKASSDDLFDNPLHPYTKGLLSAVPVVNLDIKRERIKLAGELASPIEPKDECRFLPRCQYSTDVCSQKAPETEEIMPDHFVACHNIRKINGL